MVMWCTKVIPLLLFCYARLSTVSGEVSFASENFHNSLQWDACRPARPGGEVLYSVSYNSDAADEQFLAKEECQNITAMVCDLTAETPSVHDVYYRARVYCNGALWGTTTRFKPIAHTVLGPPVLSTYSTVSSVHVDATVPLGPNGVSVADIITRSKKLPYKLGLVYTLTITKPLWATKVNETTTGRFVIDLKNNGTEFCGHVVYKPNTESGRPESERAHFCVTLPADPLVLLSWLLVGAAVLAAVIVTSAVCLCKYVNGGKGKSMPRILVTISHLPSPKLWISESEITAYATIQAKPDTTPVRSDGYSPQDKVGQNWQDGTGSSAGADERGLTPNPEDTSAHSSLTYAAVAVEEHNGGVTRAGGGHGGTGHAPAVGSRGDAVVGPGPTTRGMPHEEPGQDNAVGRLDANGQLVLLLSGDGGTPVSPEWKPCLSDLIDSGEEGTEGPSLTSILISDCSEFSDSGCDDSAVTTPTHAYCNGHNPPSRPDAPYLRQGWTDTSSGDAAQKEGYRRNSFTAILLETQSKDVSGYRTTGCAGAETEEGGGEEEDSEAEETRPILVGNWVVHIPD